MTKAQHSIGWAKAWAVLKVTTNYNVVVAASDPIDCRLRMTRKAGVILKSPLSFAVNHGGRDAAIHFYIRGKFLLSVPVEGHYIPALSTVDMKPEEM